MHLGGIALRELTYRELGPMRQLPLPATEEDITSANINVEAQLTVLGPEDAVELRLRMVITPDPSKRPMEITVQMAALYHKKRDLPLRDLLVFVSRSGGLTLFPFLRETIANVTTRGIFGPILLKPMLLGPLITDQQVDVMVHDHATAVRQQANSSATR